jgi:pimeloyl-ACP methyl ester carboxylesterase
VLRSFASGALLGERFGSGPLRVLALHGWARSHRDFAHVLGEPDPLDAVALDLPGFGSAPPPPTAWGTPEYADAIAPMLAELATPVVVLGHSFGGRVAVQLAARYPESVGALVLTGVPLVRSSAARRPRWRFRAGRVLHGAGLLSEARMEGLRQRYGSTDYRAAQGVMRQVLVRTVNEDYDEVLATIGCPTSLVWGSDDSVAPVASARELAARLSVATLVEVPSAGHLTPLTAPAALREALRQALATLEPG